MTIESSVNDSAIKPLFSPWEEPNSHRKKSDTGSAEVIEGRRPSSIAIVQNLRADVSLWRNNGYPATSETTKELLNYWFGSEHRITNIAGDSFPFNYYFCQREAIETLIYLLEHRSILTLSQLVENFGAGSEEQRYSDALGITPEEDIWTRYAFKLATGAGKTKCMSLAIVWSYFHALREPESPMAKHFLIVAPNLIVFERLKEDFANAKIFKNDPLVPMAWRNDFNPTVVLQEEAIGTAITPIIYLTNIHRLYDTNNRKKSTDEETYNWVGPSVSKSKALDTSQALRERITSHSKLMILNDEAHHVWDADSAWNECITYIRNTIFNKTGNNLVAQLDFSATPKDNNGNLFKHIVCDAPLGEAIDAGIVKIPIIGEGKLHAGTTSDNAAARYQKHLLLGYKRWLDSYEEWKDSGKKALMFVMTEDADAADQIYQELNSNEIFKELNGKTLNLHTRLKGRLITKGKGINSYKIFQASEKDISDEDLKFLRELSRSLDHDSSPYRCIVSVLMLREGWDVKNVTTIIPLRAFSAKANILPEQTLGRGLRRMTPPGTVNELLTVVEHPTFAKLYQKELANEGAIIDIVDAEKVPRITTTIFPDLQHKDLNKLKLLIPSLKAGFSQLSEISPPITIDDLRTAFSKFAPLPVAEKGNNTIEYVGKHLITNEIIQQLTIELPELLSAPAGCISYYRTELERAVKIPNLATILNPLLQKFIEQILFTEPVSIYDNNMFARFADDDVREHIRAVFIPLLSQRSKTKNERSFTDQVMDVTLWKPFQTTKSASHPVVQASKTPFNLVPCDSQFEAVLTQFLDRATDVASLCKNAGPQALRIDYINSNKQLSLYTPDFIVRSNDNKYYLIEGKGKDDKDVPLKAMAANEWCKSASVGSMNWQYLYVPQTLFEKLTGTTISSLARATAPALKELLSNTESQQLKMSSLFDQEVRDQKEQLFFDKFIQQQELESLPPTYKICITQAVKLFMLGKDMKVFHFSAVFSSLLNPLDSASKIFICNALKNYVPQNPNDQYAFFDLGIRGALERQAQNLRKTLVYNSGISPIGLLKFCLTFENKENLAGIFNAVSTAFKNYKHSQLAEDIDTINNFRNTFIAHTEDKALTDAKMAEINLQHWIETIIKLHKMNYPVAT